jgi:hypothetical protein
VPATIGNEFLIRVETEVYDLAARYCGEQSHRLLEKIEQLALLVERWSTHHRETRLQDSLSFP